MKEITCNIYGADCISGMPEYLPLTTEHIKGSVPAGAVGHVVTSIPFGALFTYSGKPEDIGNNRDGIDLEEGEFGLHMRFFIEQLWRSMMPGRIACIHIQQLLTTIVQHGNMGRRDFRNAVITLFRAGGFNWVGEVAIPKDPQAIARRQKLHSLQFKTGYDRDACTLAPAVCDFVMIFRKPGENPEPVHALYWPGKNESGWVSKEDWIAWAHGAWADILETDVLQGFAHNTSPGHKDASEEEDEKHVCPLQLEVIRRCILLYSNPSDIVMDPFMGIGSTAWVALGGRTQQKKSVAAPRSVVGFELKESYHRVALKFAAEAVQQNAPHPVETNGQITADSLGGGAKRSKRRGCITNA